MAQGSQSIHSLPVIEIDHNLLTASAEYAKISALLPSYDGNKKTLNFFIKAVENVLGIVSDSENDPSIGCLIVKKLSGKAVEILSESASFKTWPEIKKILQNRFGEFRDEITLIQELNNVHKNRMDLETFGDKIRELTYTLIGLDSSKREFYENMGMSVFIGQLSPLLSLSIRMQSPNNLEHAITLAIQEDLKLKTYRINNPVINNTQRPSNKPNNYYNSNTNRGPFPFKQNQQFIRKENIKQESSSPTKYKVNYQQNEDEDFQTENQTEDDIEQTENDSFESDFIEGANMTPTT